MAKSKTRIMQSLARYHIWLGWVVGLPMLLWIITGLVMAARPIAVVRGQHLSSAPESLNIDPRELTLPNVGEPIEGARLVRQEIDGPVWIVTTIEGGVYRYSAKDGGLIPPVARDEAISIADTLYEGDAEFESLTFFSASEAPLELRRRQPSWRVQFDDGARVYIDNSTGEVLALRTNWWRVFDLMYGLHIMDLDEREDSHHPLLLVLASLSLLGASFGCILMFRRRKARKTAPKPAA